MKRNWKFKTINIKFYLWTDTVKSYNCFYCIIRGFFIAYLTILQQPIYKQTVQAFFTTWIWRLLKVKFTNVIVYQQYLLYYYCLVYSFGSLMILYNNIFIFFSFDVIVLITGVCFADWLSRVQEQQRQCKSQNYIRVIWSDRMNARFRLLCISYRNSIYSSTNKRWDTNTCITYIPRITAQSSKPIIIFARISYYKK